MDMDEDSAQPASTAGGVLRLLGWLYGVAGVALALPVFIDLILISPSLAKALDDPELLMAMNFFGVMLVVSAGGIVIAYGLLKLKRWVPYIVTAYNLALLLTLGSDIVRALDSGRMPSFGSTFCNVTTVLALLGIAVFCWSPPARRLMLH